jgi:sulfatase maturation enzyme AslB (radical SAM superfamily)
MNIQLELKDKALQKMDKVFLTKSGLVARNDKNLGLIVFSPYTGLIFACVKNDSQGVLSWLNKEIEIPPKKIYRKALGAGWNIPFQLADYPISHLLPEPINWAIPKVDYPIVINWLLTGKCALSCRYCYAQDLMKSSNREPDRKDIENIVERILSFFPVAVVLTGGDPLLSPNLDLAIRLLYGKTGIIVDTSGYSLNEKHIEIFKKHGVLPRISIDSEIPRINDFLRPLNSRIRRINSGNFALEAICSLLKANIPVSIQTVATSKNRSDLEFLGDKLYRMGIRAWRILIVAPSSTNQKYYTSLAGTKGGQERFHKYIKTQVKIRHKHGWNKGMGVQLTHNQTPNSVVLVSPSGVFYTESRTKPGKVVIDENRKYNPRLGLLLSKIDLHAHIERYLST